MLNIIAKCIQREIVMRTSWFEPSSKVLRKQRWSSNHRCTGTNRETYVATQNPPLRYWLQLIALGSFNARKWSLRTRRYRTDTSVAAGCKLIIMNALATLTLEYFSMLRKWLTGRNIKVRVTFPTHVPSTVACIAIQQSDIVDRYVRQTKRLR